MKKLIAVVLVIAGVLIVLHHWYISGNIADLNEVFSHEFFASLCFGLGLGGLFL